MNSELLDSSHTVTMTIRVWDVPPLPLHPGVKTLLLQPETVTFTWTDGKLQSPTVAGPRVTKRGTSDVSKHHRSMWSRDEWPDWLVNLVQDYTPKETK